VKEHQRKNNPYQGTKRTL